MLVKKLLYSSFALIVGGIMLTACNKYVIQTDKKIETTLERAEDYLQQSQVPDLPEPTDTVRIQNDIWLGNQSVKIVEGDPLPAVFEKEDGITIAIAEDAQLSEILQKITDMTDIPVQLDDLKAEDAIPEEAVPVRYSGKLSGLLNYLSNRYGVYWRYKDRMITFFTKETRIFTIYSLPTQTNLSASLSGSSMGETGGGESSSSLSTSAELDVWDTIVEGIQQIAPEDQAKLSFSKPTGSVTVTASPFVIRKVADYVASWNEKLSRQVAITVRLIQVTLTNSDDYGLDLTTIFGTKSGRHHIDYKLSSGITGAGSVAMTILTGNWSLMPTINALSTQGKTRLLYTATATTLNNKVAPIQATTSKNYIKEQTVTRSGSNSDQTTDIDTEVDTLKYGLTINVLPRILDHGRLILLFSLSLSDLMELKPITSSSGASGSSSSDESQENENENENENDDDTENVTLQLPTMKQTGFMQEVAMRSGNTLVLSGFERTRDETMSSGIGKPQLGLLGGSAKNNSARDVLVVLITPEVLQSPLSQEALMRDY